MKFTSWLLMSVKVCHETPKKRHVKVFLQLFTTFALHCLRVRNPNYRVNRLVEGWYQLQPGRERADFFSLCWLHERFEQNEHFLVFNICFYIPANFSSLAPLGAYFTFFVSLPFACAIWAARRCANETENASRFSYAFRSFFFCISELNKT